MSRAVLEPVPHSSALTLGRREAERTYSSRKRLKPCSARSSRPPAILLPIASDMYLPVPHRKPCPPPDATAVVRCYPHCHERKKEGREGRSIPRGRTCEAQRLGGARCGVSNVLPCDHIERGETKSSRPEGATYKHTMVSERRERELPPGDLWCRRSSQSRRMAISFAVGAPCITRRRQ
jgi:hypothetical protein